jgi:hypothetical protein
VPTVAASGTCTKSRDDDANLAVLSLSLDSRFDMSAVPIHARAAAAAAEDRRPSDVPLSRLLHPLATKNDSIRCRIVNDEPPAAQNDPRNNHEGQS